MTVPEAHPPRPACWWEKMRHWFLLVFLKSLDFATRDWWVFNWHIGVVIVSVCAVTTGQIVVTSISMPVGSSGSCLLIHCSFVGLLAPPCCGTLDHPASSAWLCLGVFPREIAALWFRSVSFVLASTQEPGQGIIIIIIFSNNIFQFRPFCSQWCNFHSSFWLIFHCALMSHCLYPFIPRWAPRLNLCFSYRGWCCSEHRVCCLTKVQFVLKVVNRACIFNSLVSNSKYHQDEKKWISGNGLSVLKIKRKKRSHFHGAKGITSMDKVARINWRRQLEGPQ